MCVSTRGLILLVYKGLCGWLFVRMRSKGFVECRWGIVPFYGVRLLESILGLLRGLFGVVGFGGMLFVGEFECVT